MGCDKDVCNLLAEWLGIKYRISLALPLLHLAAGYTRATLNTQDDSTTRKIQLEFLSLSLEENHSVEWPLHKQEIIFYHVKSLRFWGCLLQHLALPTLTNVGIITGF